MFEILMVGKAEDGAWVCRVRDDETGQEADGYASDPESCVRAAKDRLGEPDSRKRNPDSASH